MTKKKTSKSRAKKLPGKKEILNSLDAVVDKSVEELIEESKEETTDEHADGQAWKKGKSVKCLPDESE